MWAHKSEMISNLDGKKVQTLSSFVYIINRSLLGNLKFC